MSQDETPRVLVIDDGTRRALVALRLLEAPSPPVLDLDARAIADVREALGAELPDSVLAVFAANVSELSDNAEMALASVVAFTRNARACGCPAELVAVGRQPDGHAYYCIDPRRPAGSIDLIDFDLGDHSLSRKPLAEWLNDRVEAARDFLRDGDEEEAERAEVMPTADDWLAFAPRIVASASHSGLRRVRHKTFGTGTVVRDLDGGKFEIEFEDGGKRVLLGRFVEKA